MPRNYTIIDWGDDPNHRVLVNRLIDEVGCTDEWDLIIGFYSRPLIVSLIDSTIGGWLGAIDDTYRRFIVVKSLDKWVLTHEIIRAFILSNFHYVFGLMSPFRVVVLPGLSIDSYYLSREQVDEVMKNKWRDFCTMIGS